VSKPEALTLTVSSRGQSQARLKDNGPRPEGLRGEYIHSFVKIADWVEVNVDLKVERVGGPWLVLKQWAGWDSPGCHCRDANYGSIVAIRGTRRTKTTSPRWFALSPLWTL
jgi:hypothetical protein